MKTPALFLLLFLIPASIFASDTYTHDELIQKQHRYEQMNNGGTILLAAGIPLLIGGVVVSTIGSQNAIRAVDNRDTPNGGDVAMWVGGSIASGFGFPMIIAGSVLKFIGSKKSREYKERIRVDIGPNTMTMTVDF